MSCPPSSEFVGFVHRNCACYQANSDSTLLDFPKFNVCLFYFSVCGWQKPKFTQLELHGWQWHYTEWYKSSGILFLYLWYSLSHRSVSWCYLVSTTFSKSFSESTNDLVMFSNVQSASFKAWFNSNGPCWVRHSSFTWAQLPTAAKNCKDMQEQCYFQVSFNRFCHILSTVDQQARPMTYCFKGSNTTMYSTHFVHLFVLPMIRNVGYQTAVQFYLQLAGHVIPGISIF